MLPELVDLCGAKITQEANSWVASSPSWGTHNCNLTRYLFRFSQAIHLKVAGNILA